MVLGNQNIQNYQGQQNISSGIQQPYYNTQQNMNHNRIYDNQNINQNISNSYAQPYSPYYNYNQGSYINPPNSSNNQIWVQGEAGAKAFPVGNGSAVMLMDSESDVFYIKSTDANGVPLPLRIFEYKERELNQNKNTESNLNIDNYITRDEFEAKIAELNNMLLGGGNKNEPVIQPSKQKSNSANNKQYVKRNTAVQ